MVALASCTESCSSTWKPSLPLRFSLIKYRNLRGRHLLLANRWKGRYLAVSRSLDFGCCNSNANSSFVKKGMTDKDLLFQQGSDQLSTFDHIHGLSFLNMFGFHSTHPCTEICHSRRYLYKGIQNDVVLPIHDGHSPLGPTFYHRSQYAHHRTIQCDILFLDGICWNRIHSLLHLFIFLGSFDELIPFL